MTSAVMDKLVRDGSGRVIIDADEPLTITLREEDGKFAIQCDQGHCAFAEAAKREFPGLISVQVGKYYTRFCWPEHIVRYRNSHAMAAQIKQFDKTKTFELGEYRLLAVTPTNRLGARPSPRIAKTEKPGRKVPHGPQSTRDMTMTRPTMWSFTASETKKKRPYKKRATTN